MPFPTPFKLLAITREKDHIMGRVFSLHAADLWSIPDIADGHL